MVMSQVLTQAVTGSDPDRWQVLTQAGHGFWPRWVTGSDPGLKSVPVWLYPEKKSTILMSLIWSNPEHITWSGLQTVKEKVFGSVMLDYWSVIDPPLIDSTLSFCCWFLSLLLLFSYPSLCLFLFGFPFIAFNISFNHLPQSPPPHTHTLPVPSEHVGGRSVYFQRAGYAPTMRQI